MSRADICVPYWRASARAATAASEARGARNRRKVLEALREANGQRSNHQLAVLTGLSYTRVWRALQWLVGSGAVIASGPGNNRRFEIPPSVDLQDTGTGMNSGGPASESAAGACAGEFLTPAVRPGKAA
jgi:hypothetical protein